MRKVFIVSLVALLGACSAIPREGVQTLRVTHYDNTPPLGEPFRDQATIKIVMLTAEQWHNRQEYLGGVPADQLRLIDEFTFAGLGGQATGEGLASPTPNKEDVCTVYLIKPTNGNDAPLIYSMGHEFSHCFFGSYHGNLSGMKGAGA